MKRIFIVWLMLLVSLCAFAQRKALIIASDSAAEVKFTSAVNDANLVADAFRALDYQVTLALNPDYSSFKKAVDTFIRDLGTDETAVFYYSGFSNTDKGKNYLIPAFGTGKKAASAQVVDLEPILAGIAKADNSFAFLELRQLAAGFPQNLCSKSNALEALPQAKKNQALAVASSPGKKLLAKDNEYSIFSYSLVQNMMGGMMDYPELMGATVKEVKRVTNNTQVPYWQNNLRSPFSFFNPEIPLKMRFQRPLFRAIEGGGSYNF